MAMSFLLVSALSISPTANNPSCNLSGDFTGGTKIQASPHHSVVTICESDKVWTLQTTVAVFISFPVALH